MQPHTSNIDLRDAQALALALSCSELSGPYEAASKSLEALHDLLEEIGEASDGISFQPKVAPLDQAFSECRRVLHAIDRALEYQDRQPLANNKSSVKFAARIDVANKKLLHAYRTSERNRQNYQSVSVCNPQRLSSSSSELDGATKMPSSPQALKCIQKSRPVTSRSDLYPLGQTKPGVAAVEHAVLSKMKDLPRLSHTAFDSWQSPFALMDPMSSDIEAASYLILAGDAPTTSDMNTPRSVSKQIERAVPEIVASGRCHNMAQVSDLGNISTANQANALQVEDASLSYRDSNTYETSTCISPSAARSDRHGRSTAPPACPQPSRASDLKTLSPDQLYRKSDVNADARRETGTKSKYRVVNAGPIETQEDLSGDSSEDDGQSSGIGASGMPELSHKDSRRELRRGSMPLERKRMARLFDQESDIGADSEDQTPLSRMSGELSSRPVDKVSISSSGLVIRDEAENITLVIEAWNSGRMDQAEAHLQDLLTLPVQPDTSKRVRHLLGVIASLDGRLEQALTYFASALDTPLVDVSHLNAGESAAAYWMGDIYSLAGRRSEALIAYSIVEHGLTSSKCIYPTTLRRQLLQRLQAEQKVCRDGDDKLAFEIELDKIMCYDDPVGLDSILNPDIMTRNIAQKFLDKLSWTTNSAAPVAEPNQSRAMALENSGLDHYQYNLELSISALEPSAPWPLPFDPLFASANVACGLPVSSKRDLLRLKDVARTGGALGRSRMNCFTCHDLRWLITTLRACMERLELKYTEVANATGTWLIPQYSSTEGTIVMTNFVSFAIFRLTFRSGYGVELCPGGFFSSRITKAEAGEKGSAKLHELKRVKKLIRNYLDAALRRKEAAEERDTVIPVVSINGVTSIHMPMSSKGKRAESDLSSSPAISSRSASLFG